MKTFKLISLKIIEHEDGKKQNITLQDGLIIDQEVDKNRWIIEAFIDKGYIDLFYHLKNKTEVYIEVKITKESNDPASFVTNIASINEIDDRINVIFVGKILDERKSKLEEKLAGLIEAGYEGEELLQRFKKSL